MAGIEERAAVRERIVGIGDGEIVAVRGAAEVDHAAAVVADFQQQTRVSRGAAAPGCRSRRASRDS